MAMQRRQEDDGMITKVVSINRVSKTVKGGRVMKFAALIVVGDGKGNIGYGVGKSGEVPEAIRKGEGAAKKNMRKVCLKGTTIPHEIVGEYGAGRVLMRPAAPGTGVLAGGPVRAVLECAGIKDIRAKSLRSNNPINVTAATFAGLCGLTDAEADVLYQGRFAVADGKVLGAAVEFRIAHSRPSCVWRRTSSQMTTGAPKTAVTELMDSSVGANRLRAMRSQSRQNAAPPRQQPGRT